jgi:hypothetical protein
MRVFDTTVLRVTHVRSELAFLCTGVRKLRRGSAFVMSVRGASPFGSPINWFVASMLRDYPTDGEIGASEERLLIAVRTLG